MNLLLQFPFVRLQIFLIFLIFYAIVRRSFIAAVIVIVIFSFYHYGEIGNRNPAVIKAPGYGTIATVDDGRITLERSLFDARVITAPIDGQVVFDAESCRIGSIELVGVVALVSNKSFVKQNDIIGFGRLREIRIANSASLLVEPGDYIRATISNIALIH